MIAVSVLAASETEEPAAPGEGSEDPDDFDCVPLETSSGEPLSPPSREPTAEASTPEGEEIEAPLGTVSMGAEEVEVALPTSLSVVIASVVGSSKGASPISVDGPAPSASRPSSEAGVETASASQQGEGIKLRAEAK